MDLGICFLKVFLRNELFVTFRTISSETQMSSTCSAVSSSVVSEMVRRPIRRRLRVLMLALIAVTAHASLHPRRETFDLPHMSTWNRKTRLLSRSAPSPMACWLILDVAHRFDFLFCTRPRAATGVRNRSTHHHSGLLRKYWELICF